MFTKCAIVHTLSTSSNVFHFFFGGGVIIFGFINTWFRQDLILVNHEIQLSGAMPIGLMVEYTNSQFYLNQNCSLPEFVL